MHLTFHGVYETMWSVSDLNSRWGTEIAGLVADVSFMTHLDTQIKLFVRLVACSPPPPPPPRYYQFLFLSFSYRHGVTTATQQSFTTCNDQTC